MAMSVAVELGRSARTGRLAEEHLLVVAVPVALEELGRIVFALELQELDELRKRGFDLALQRVAVIGGVVAAAVAKTDVDQRPEGVGGADHGARGALDVQVED